MPEKSIEIYTDGSSLGNPGPAGWAAVLKFGDKRKEISKGYFNSTNNRMEFMAFIYAIKELKNNNHKINVFSDSNLLVQMINQNWIGSWKKKNWKKSDKKPVLNLDLVKEIDQIINNYNISINWVKAHNGNEENERCDVLAKEAAENPTQHDVVFENEAKLKVT